MHLWLAAHGARSRHRRTWSSSPRNSRKGAAASATSVGHFVVPMPCHRRGATLAPACRFIQTSIRSLHFLRTRVKC